MPLLPLNPFPSRNAESNCIEPTVRDEGNNGKQSYWYAFALSKRGIRTPMGRHETLRGGLFPGLLIGRL